MIDGVERIENEVRRSFNEDLEEKLKKLTDVLEAVYKCPACILDRNDALNKIMETYKEVRNKCIHQKQYY